MVYIPRMPAMPSMPSMAQLEHKARAIQQQMEMRIKSLTNNGTRALTQAEIDQLAREFAHRMR